MSPRAAEVAARYAEAVLSPEYRLANNAAFEAAGDIAAYHEQKANAEFIVLTTASTHPNSNERAWEMRRLATISQLGSTSLGAFNDYFGSQGGESKPGTLSAADLGAGRSEVVHTNQMIMNVGRQVEEPLEFIDQTLERVRSRPLSATGPETYATALKLFVDKFKKLERDELRAYGTDAAREAIKESVDRCMDGFVHIARSDRPNFVEMTNLYIAINTLPKGSFDKKYTNDIIRHSLEQLPTYESRTAELTVAALGKLDLSDTGEAAANLIDLALRKMHLMERTQVLRQTARAIAGLPASPAAERTLTTFLDMRHNLELSDDIQGHESTMYALLRIARDVVTDNQELTVQIKDLAGSCQEAATREVNRQLKLSGMSLHDSGRLKATIGRIQACYRRI